MNYMAQQWVPTMIRELFAPEVKQHNKSIDELIDKNNQLIGAWNPGFNYSGDNYGYGGRYAAHVPALRLELFPTMQRLTSLRKQVDLDRILITQFLHRLLQPCQGTQDVRNALPESMVGLSTFLPSFIRTADPAFTLTNPRDLRQYEKLLPKIEMYCAMRYIY